MNKKQKLILKLLKSSDHRISTSVPQQDVSNILFVHVNDKLGFTAILTPHRLVLRFYENRYTVNLHDPDTAAQIKNIIDKELQEQEND